MSNTFSKIYIQMVFGVKHRQALISESWSEELRKYITGIVQNKGHKMLAIGTMPDHIHIFIQFKPHMSISDLVREIKKSSTEMINGKQLSKFKFQWQEGYGAFSYNKEDISCICNYIENQRNIIETSHLRKNMFPC